MRRAIRQAAARRIRQARHDQRGFAPTPLQIALGVLGMVILGGAALVGFSRFTASAREAVVDQNIVLAAQMLQRVYDENRSDLTSGVTATTGAASGLALDTLAARTDGLTWENNWDNISAADPADPTVVRIEFINTNTAVRTAAASATTRTTVAATVVTGAIPTDAPLAPAVSWIAAAGDAARIWIGDSDGNWVCALVVDRPNFDYVTTANPRLDRASGTVTNAAAGATVVNAQEAALEIRGIWYDSGQRADLTAASVLQDCSPVSDEANDKSRLPDGNDAGWDLVRSGDDVELTRTLG